MIFWQWSSLRWRPSWGFRQMLGTQVHFPTPPQTSCVTMDEPLRASYLNIFRCLKVQIGMWEDFQKCLGAEFPSEIKVS